MTSFPLLPIGFGIAGCVLLAFVRSRRCKKYRPPPGPPGVLVLGNAFDIPSEYQWIVFNEWKKSYGDVFQLSALGTRMIVINSRKALESLLVERGSSYSSRAPMTVMRKVYVDMSSNCIWMMNDTNLQARLRMVNCSTAARGGNSSL